MKAVGKNLRDTMSTQLASHLSLRAADVVAADGTDAAFGVDAARGLPLAVTPSVPLPTAIPPADDEDDDDDVSLSVVRNVDDDAL